MPLPLMSFISIAYFMMLFSLDASETIILPNQSKMASPVSLGDLGAISCTHSSDCKSFIRYGMYIIEFQI